MQTKAVISAVAAAGLGLGVAACGGSSSKSAQSAGIEPAPSAGATTEQVTTTPSSGPLSKQPKVSLPKGPAPSKVVTKDLVKGTGQAAKSSSTVVVNYVGELYKNGKVFDSSWKNGQTATLPLSGVIPGWGKGMVGMKVGGRRELIIPASQAYGKKGQPQAGIPANAPLVFVVDLLKVEAGSASPAASPAAGPGA